MHHPQEGMSWGKQCQDLRKAAIDTSIAPGIHKVWPQEF